MDSSVEAHRQMQLTFQDKSTDANLNVEVTREGWLNEVAESMAVQSANGDQAAAKTEAVNLDVGASVGSSDPKSDTQADAHDVALVASASGGEGEIVWKTAEEISTSVNEVIEEIHQQQATDAALATNATNNAIGIAAYAEAGATTDFNASTSAAGAAEASAVSAVLAPAISDVTEIEEMDFSREPLPEALTEASEKVVSALGGLTLPAALCDEELLQELAQIPEKMGFKIGEVAEMLGIKQYVLRYWETEFDVLKPKKAANNQRYYTKKDVENVYLIRKLLHRDRFSIEGARAALKDLKSVVKKEKDWSSVNHKVEALHERVDHLVLDLRKLRQLFAD